MSSEKEIRQKLIDEKLRAAGWSMENGNLVNEQYLPPTSPNLVKEKKESAESYTLHSSEKRFADYAMLDKDQRPIAILEAKNDGRSPLDGLEQVAEYADCIFAQIRKHPFIFLSNGNETYFWDREYYPPRKVSNIYTLEDMERVRDLRLYTQPLHIFKPEPAIVEREYQIQAIQTIVDGIKQRKHKFLLVMATGTGKTRTVIALIDLLIRAKRVNRVLFLADRRELVRQASQAFKEFLPNEPLHWIENGIKQDEATIHLATYPGMMQVLSQVSTGYYDLIIADESHRSIYNRYQAIFTHLDAIHIGLTATPTDFIDHNTFQLFDCFDARPTFAYPFETAVEEDYLVTFKVLEASTRFQITGIRGKELPAEFQRQIEEQGLDPGEIDFEGSDLERRVTNTGTNDQIVREFMQHARTDALGLPAKSIFFAVSHRHALELFESFNRLYPGLQTRGLAKVIDSRMERSEIVLDAFKTKDMPRVAISVDMLDTGIDVPAIQNLVFAKPVYSQVKFWQMIGRGTRLWHDPITGASKNDFLIIDHWNNFAYFDIHPERGNESYLSEPLQTRLFRLRLQRLAILQTQGNEPLSQETRASLEIMLAELACANNIQVNEQKVYLSQQVFLDLQLIQHDPAKKNHLERVIAPLMRFLPNVNAHILRFGIHTEELILALLEDKSERFPRLREQIMDDLQRLPEGLPEVQAQEALLTQASNALFWNPPILGRILRLQREIAPLMRFRLAEPRNLIKLRLPDQMQRRRWITYGPAGEGAFADQYRSQVETYVKSLAAQEPTLDKLKRQRQLTANEFAALTDLLNKPDLFIREEILQQVYEHPEMRLVDFILSILEGKTDQLPSRVQTIEEAFQQFLKQRPRFTQAQRQFVYALRNLLHQQALSGIRTPLTPERLTQIPFKRIGQPENLFSTQDLEILLQFVNYQISQIIEDTGGKEHKQA